MENNDFVGPSRDGDQFHYHWAARRCLAMLATDSDLVAVTVEGVPLQEGATLKAGLDAVDVAEYRGTDDLTTATSVRYLQLKHSTRASDKSWQVSGLKKTLGNFGKRYAGLVKRFGAADVSQRFLFEFLSNRPIAASVTTPLALLQAGISDTRTARLAAAIGLSGELLIGFAKCLVLTGRARDYLTQRALLDEETFAYLPERDTEAPLRLKELVTRRATSEYEGRPEITRRHLLEALGAREADLFPAKMVIELPLATVARRQHRTLVDAIVATPGAFILEADGGVGKSVLACNIAGLLPASSETFVYDCFGNAAYRSATGYRHRPRDGFVQLANEMASRRLCDPLVPSNRAEQAAYVQAFVARVNQASAVVAARGPGAILAIVIDAADNAEMAAAEVHDAPSFARLILRETLPDNVRLVLTARPHRVRFLLPPPQVRRLTLEAFDEEETAHHLRSVYPEATALDAREFHRLTSHNPRVQAAAFADGGTIAQMLARLGTVPMTVDDTIERLLDAALAKLRDEAGERDLPDVDLVLTALATLRPFVPLATVAATANVEVSLVRSIASDLARPLLIRDDAVQFRDEPTETWFRERFRPSPAQLAGFIALLRPQAANSPYVAATLPQLMLEAGQFDELVALALSDGGLPEQDALARRDVQLQRLQFAIKAALRARRFADAAALAMKAGREAAADARQQGMLSANADLAGRFLEPDQMLEQVSRRLIRGGEWTGSHHAYEASFLSSVPALHGDARSHLRIAYEWLNHWAGAVGDQKRTNVTANDAAELSLATLNLHGAESCATELRRWRRREMSFAAGRILAARLVDAGRYSDLDALAHAAGNDLGLILALCVEFEEIGRAPPRAPVHRALRIACRPGVMIRACTGHQAEINQLRAVLALIRAGLATRTGSRPALARMLARYLPAEPPYAVESDRGGYRSDRIVYLMGYALLAALRGRTLALDFFLAKPRKPKRGKKKQQDKPARRERDVHRLRQTLGPLLPWCQLWAKAQLGTGVATAEQIGAAHQAWATAGGASGRDRSSTADEVALLWGDLLGVDGVAWSELAAWQETLKAPWFIPTSVALARRAAHVDLTQIALDLAQGAFKLATDMRDDAESQIDSCVTIARAVLPVSPGEAKAYFDRAVTLSSQVGDENVPSWEAVLDLSVAATRDAIDMPELAHRFARAAEMTYAHCVRDKHFDWTRSVEQLGALSPRAAPAQFSRWLDRRFSDEARYLPDLAEQLIARGSLSPDLGLVLGAFGGNWHEADLLKRILAASSIAEHRAAAAALLVDALRLSGAGTGTWEHILQLLTRHGLDVTQARAGLALARLTDWRPKRAPTRVAGNRARARPNYARLFRNVTVTEPAGIATAVARLKARKGPYEWRLFWSAAMARVPAGAEARFLEALGSGLPPSLYTVRQLVEALPAPWLGRAAVRPALARLIRAQCRGDSQHLSVTPHYEVIPWSRIETLCGLTRRDLAGEAVAVMGEQDATLSADALFRLVSLLSLLMSPGEALGALDKALALYEPLFEPETGDGAFTHALLPSPTLGTPWAGYIWAALGAPGAARRWQAAHAVRRLARLGATECLADIVELARQGSGGAFVDQKLRFYALHARLWLLIALARAAVESPEAVAAHADWLAGFTTPDEAHLLLRSFAARALLTLDAQGVRTLDTADRVRLSGMVTGAIPPAHGAAAKKKVGKPPSEDECFSVNHELERHEVSTVAMALDIDQNRVTAAMHDVVREAWGLADRGHWNEDPRAGRDLYPEEDGRYGGMRGDMDVLSYYLSFHALQVAAGRLFAERAQDPAFDRTAVMAWVSEQGLTGGDGRWLADRRDPTPLDLALVPEGEDRAWPASPTEADVPGHLFPTPGWVCVNARYTRYAGKRREQVSIASGLAAPDRARALARALQAAGNVWGLEIPYGSGEEGIDAYGFQFCGWLDRDRDEKQLDGRDPWAAELGTTQIVPGDLSKTALGLVADPGFRNWRDAHGNTVLRAERWSDGIDGDMVRFGGGHRLCMRSSAFAQLVRRTGMSLLVRVRIERDLAELRHDSFREKDIADAKPITRIFLYEQDGWWRPGSPAQTG